MKRSALIAAALLTVATIASAQTASLPVPQAPVARDVVIAGLKGKQHLQPGPDIWPSRGDQSPPHPNIGRTSVNPPSPGRQHTRINDPNRAVG